MTIDELEQEISSVPRFGAGGGLDNLKKYLDILGHPEESLRVIHVAGTNGKGSVCAFLSPFCGPPVTVPLCLLHRIWCI